MTGCGGSAAVPVKDQPPQAQVIVLIGVAAVLRWFAAVVCGGWEKHEQKQCCGGSAVVGRGAPHTPYAPSAAFW
jgi:hypothetical protein